VILSKPIKQAPGCPGLHDDQVTLDQGEERSQMAWPPGTRLEVLLPDGLAVRGLETEQMAHGPRE